MVPLTSVDRAMSIAFPAFPVRSNKYSSTSGWTVPSSGQTDRVNLHLTRSCATLRNLFAEKDSHGLACERRHVHRMGYPTSVPGRIGCLRTGRERIQVLQNGVGGRVADFDVVESRQGGRIAKSKIPLNAIEPRRVADAPDAMVTSWYI